MLEIIFHIKHAKQSFKRALKSKSEYRETPRGKSFTTIKFHCIKYAEIRDFTDPYSPVQGKNLRFCPYKGEYGQ